MPPHFHAGKEPPKFKGKEVRTERVFEGGTSTSVKITKLKNGMLFRGANFTTRASGYGIAIFRGNDGAVTTYHKQLTMGPSQPWFRVEHKSIKEIRDHIAHLDGKISDAKAIDVEIDKMRETARQKGENAPSQQMVNVTEMLMHRDILQRTLTVLEEMDKAGS